MNSIEFYHINKILDRVLIASIFVWLLSVVMLITLILWEDLTLKSINEKPTCPEGVTINVANEELVKQLKNNKNVYLILRTEK